MNQGSDYLNIFDIARESGVSISTVSRVINNPELVKVETKEKILKIINDANYTPNSMARGLAKKESMIIGVVIPNINNPFYSEIVRAIQDISSQKGYSVIICNTDENMDEEKRIISTLVSKQVDGIIFAGGRRLSEESNEYIRKLALNLPIVFVCEDIVDDNIYCVNTNKEMGMYILTNYLIKLGHKKIALINTLAGYKPSEEKLNGYKKALKEKDITYDPSIILSAENTIQGGYKSAESLLKNIKGVTAVISSSDIMAMGVMTIFIKNNYRVPEDISITGFDNITISEYFNPPLTTVSINLYKMAKEATIILDKLLKLNTVKTKIKMIEPRLIVRNSCR